MSSDDVPFTACHNCDRGGNGNAKDKCACGWKVTKPGPLGCFIGRPIVGERKQHPKVSRSKARYLRYLDVSECFSSFREFLKHENDGQVPTIERLY